MTLGEIIREYIDEHGLMEFLNSSGLSKQYTYMLINNKNNRGKPINPSMETIYKVAKGVHQPFEEVFSRLDKNITVAVRSASVEDDYKKRRMGIETGFTVSNGHGYAIRVLGRVAAGEPIEMIEESIGFIEVESKKALSGEYFGLKIRGDSMEPRIQNGDIVVVHKQEDAENGAIAIVAINGDDATCKKIEKSEDGITLIPLNNKYGKRFYSNEDIESFPVRIIGVAVEVRGEL